MLEDSFLLSHCPIVEMTVDLRRVHLRTFCVPLFPTLPVVMTFVTRQETGSFQALLWRGLNEAERGAGPACPRPPLPAGPPAPREPRQQ